MVKPPYRYELDLENDNLFSDAANKFIPVEKTKPLRDQRRLILCLDGSWQSSNHGEKNIASNIAKLSRAIASCDKYGEDGKEIQQIVYYDAGVGTGNSAPNEDASKTAKLLAMTQKIFEGTFGRGVEENVCEAYNFLVSNWLPGDEIYIFGFSRGAYTARAVAGLVCNLGICFPDMMDDWWVTYDEYKNRELPKKVTKPPNNAVANDAVHMHYQVARESLPPSVETKKNWRERFYKPVPIQVVGVFDTVGALGWPSNVVMSVEQTNDAKYGFHDTDLHENVKHAFHALALDEHRKAFPPTLWTLPEGVSTKLRQCWFPGYHINIGGGSNDTMDHYGDMESMANLSLVWMIDQVREHTNLVFDRYALAKFYHHYTCTIVDLSQRSFKLNDSEHNYAKKADKKAKKPRHTDDKPDPKNPTAYGGWGMGYRPDSIESMTGYSGSVVRTPGYYQQGVTNECIHPVVAYAMSKGYREANVDGKILHYKPAALEGYKRDRLPEIRNSEGKVTRKEGWYWRKEIKGVKYDDTPYTTRLSNWWSSYSPPEHDDEIIIPEMVFTLPEDDYHMFSQRDYMRADWLALKAGLDGYHDDFQKAFLDFGPKQDYQIASEDDKRRERLLLNAVRYVTDRETSSSCLDKSLIHVLRRSQSLGLKAEEKLALLKETGDRTRAFFATLPVGECPFTE
ncbi:hypothetical protein N7466_007286 [Penicillium verhagenii]|uniref:uncharacterized protein n=1 Tax=Penicillium verhagenii TaxID=1562060 RepID=UPI0025452F81|nr:uncharacterized protein N7466_007286 [Penicillium verhagenii]KAJ5928330.1 hypothetical protein N7466_007286 [Penicillium verhagenii]